MKRLGLLLGAAVLSGCSLIPGGLGVKQKPNDGVVMENEGEQGGEMMQTNDNKMMKDDEEMMEDKQSDAGQSGGYVSYSQQTYNANKGKKRILFFHANWCPDCKATDEEILSRLNDIPENVVILKTDYDTETALKQKYGVTYQHTFVVVDESGNEVKKWNGGTFDQIISRAG